MSKILVIRFAAIGDVAMTIPVIHSLARQFPEHQITMLSKKSLSPLFQEVPANIKFWEADLNGAHKGFSGMNRLYKELSREGFDYVVDLNAVLRSLFLTTRFALNGHTSVSVVRKAKNEQRRLTRRRNKRMEPLPSTFERYRDAFTRLGFFFEFNFHSIFEGKERNLTEIEATFGRKENTKWIGIAPFAKHRGKIYPIELQEQVVAHFSGKTDMQLFLFGGSEEEKKQFDVWISKYPRVYRVAGKLDMHKELLLMSSLDIMLTMDSANMHFASLVDTPVVSVWGATHPYSGFMGWGQKEQNAVQLQLDCRPCSSHGTKPCYKHTWECMYNIPPIKIIERIESLLYIQENNFNETL